MQALETATTNPAELLGLGNRWGQVATGYGANLVLLKANPLVDITNTQTILSSSSCSRAKERRMQSGIRSGPRLRMQPNQAQAALPGGSETRSIGLLLAVASFELILPGD